MKLHLLNRSSVPNESLRVTHNLGAHFLRVWHYHPEFELVVILQSSGTRFIGDSIEKFEEGEVVLIGKNVPHMWLNDELYFQKDSMLQAEAVAIHFKKEFLGADFFAIPEMQHISNLLDRAEHGIKFHDLKNGLRDEIKNLVEYDSTTRIYKFIKILDGLSKHGKQDELASGNYVSSFHKTNSKRLDKIYAYVFENFNDGISAGEVAEIAGMNKAAFSRFFKKVHRKTFTRFLNEVRIGYACRLILENKESITVIAYLAGFNNISNFNRQFKLVQGKSPSSYFKQYASKR
ncbi:MAG: AraC family transcriptional regulator [Pricia sp.]|nr:AraC family transcriptional regulator [Pricia sp.]